MAQCNFFEPSSNTSSATKCKWCGMEKYFHVPIINMAQQTAVDLLNMYDEEIPVEDGLTKGMSNRGMEC